MNKVPHMIGIIFIISIIIFLIIGVYKEKEIASQNGFENTKKEFESGNYTKIFDIPEIYYRNPKFYPFYDDYVGLNKTGKAIYGYGAYPGKASGNIETLNNSDYINIYTLILTSYDVISFQGIGLSLTTPNKELFDTYVEPSDILLLPISDNSTGNLSWVYKIKMTIIAKKDIPKGEYIFKLKARDPSLDNDSRFYNISKEYNMSDKYMTTGMIEPSKFFDFILKVNN